MNNNKNPNSGGEEVRPRVGWLMVVSIGLGVLGSCALVTLILVGGVYSPIPAWVPLVLLVPGFLIGILSLSRAKSGGGPRSVAIKLYELFVWWMIIGTVLTFMTPMLPSSELWKVLVPMLIVGAVLAVLAIPVPAIIAGKREAMTAIRWIVGIIIASGLVWVLAMDSAWKIGHWVGRGAGAPQIAQTIAIAPSVLDGIGGIVCIVLSIARESRLLLAVGVAALEIGAFLLLLSGWFFAMGSIG